MNVYHTIEENIKQHQKMLAVLLDPDKCQGKVRKIVLHEFNKIQPDFIFIGGSKVTESISELIYFFKDIQAPKILFPGDASQFTPEADALLLLSLTSGRNADYLIGQHVKSAQNIKKSSIEVIPTAYILIDGGNDSAVKTISHTLPIAADDVDTVISTAIAGELLGLQMTYLEAGSGADKPIAADIISSVKNEISHPLIVGGGIKNAKNLKIAFDSGADIVVIGNFFEIHPEKIAEFINFARDIK